VATYFDERVVITGYILVSEILNQIQRILRNNQPFIFFRPALNPNILTFPLNQSKPKPLNRSLRNNMISITTILNNIRIVNTIMYVIFVHELG
jgi:hypothetical protein